LAHEQHPLLVSISLKKGIPAGIGTATAAPMHGQHSTFGTQFGFSQTNSHFGFGHGGLWHFQSHLGSSQTASHSGFGAWQ
jgi:hypothetical protein